MTAPHVPDGLRAVVLKCLEKPIERRTEQLIDAFARTRIDVSYSDALSKWVVAVMKPATRFDGREHHLIAAKSSLAEAKKIAHGLWDAEGKLPMLIIRDRDR